MPENIDLNPQFEKTLNLLQNSNKHLFITGKAGTGKSTLLNYFRSITQRKYVVLAPTGIAAVNIEGETIHSFFGFPPGINPHEAKQEAHKRKETDIFRKLELVVIDEISMVRADLLDSIDVFLKTARHNDAPFGGVQMVFLGDLYQLPPVVTYEEKQTFAMLYRSPYFFSSHVMHEMFSGFYAPFELIELEKIYRQKDGEFIELLNRIRNKTADFDVIKKLNERYLTNFQETDEYVHLVTTNVQADEINRKKLDQLSGFPRKFKGKVTGEFESKGFPTEENLTLKIDTRVMFVRNDPEGRWINGTVGTVKSFASSGMDQIVTVQIDNGNIVDVEPMSWSNYKSTFNKETQSIDKQEIGTYTQIPLKLAWAFTIHKSQGKTFEKVILDIGNGAFAHGQMYVALSRCKSFEGLVLKKPIREFDIKMDKIVEDFMNALRSRQD